MADPDSVRGLTDACDEAGIALKLFLEGKFDEAETYVIERKKEWEVAHNVVPIFTHCHAVILFAKATISGAEDDRKQASDKLSVSASMAREHLPKQGWVQSITSWGLGYFSSTSPQEEITEEELSCRIIEAEAAFLSAILCFFGESMASFLRAALLIRKAMHGYKHCQTILQWQCHIHRSNHEIGAVQLGFGGFNLVISLLPPKLLYVLSVLGFPCDRAAGLTAIEQSLHGGGLRSSVSGMLLLSYHVILPAFCSIPQERGQHVDSAERVFAYLQETFPGSFFLGFYRGRLQRLKKDVIGSIDCFTKLEEEIKIPSTSKFFKLRHAWLYELAVSYMMQLQWQAAGKCWAELEQETLWSSAFFAYLEGVCLCMQGETADAACKFAKVQGLMRGTVSGRVLTVEQYASRKVKDHALDSEKGANSLQGHISGIEFLYLWNSFPQMSADKLEGVLRIIEEAEALLHCQAKGNDGFNGSSFQAPYTRGVSELWGEEEAEDDVAICALMKGTALRELGKLHEAQQCLEYIREETCHVETELFVTPMAAYERSLLLISQHAKTLNSDLLLQARHELAVAEGFKHDYNFLWRLLGRIHAARGAIQVLLKEEVKPIATEATTSVKYETEG